MNLDLREPIRIGIAGLGRAGLESHVRELEKLTDYYRIVAVCDLLKERRDLVAEKFNCRTYRRYEDLLRDSEIELIDIATRSDDHLAHAIAALKTGKWVMLETPMGVNHEEALMLRAAAIKAHNRLFVYHDFHFDPGLQHAREVMNSGILGDIYDIKLRYGCFFRRDDWQTVARCGGGQLLHTGTHLIEQALRFLNSPPVKVFSDFKRVAALGDAEDYARIVLRDAGGLTVDIEASDGRILATPQCLVTGASGGLSLSGSEISLKYLDPKVKLARRRSSVRTPPLSFDAAPPENLAWIEETIPVAPKEASGSSAIWEYLAAAIRLNRTFPVSLDDALEVMRVVSLVRKESIFA